MNYLVTPLRILFLPLDIIRSQLTLCDIKDSFPQWTSLFETV